ncbi:cell wall-binding repeat-containing protein [Alkalihalobacillus sp. CinArs1]|uniref:cell wall-binding repeat-containing protein n=1 Tax=Alkalihalobacillus sp. CinArs1 TaxID=2995314 RepID=UPI0022DDC563|nr:cell wall-binding repeat-containing protein [Alkalihalobacillus sp. CinArs1]
MNMKKPFIAVLSSAALAMGIAAAAPATPSEAATGNFDLTIMHTNDTHAHLENAPKRLTAIKDIRAERENSILVDGGDVFSGTLFFNKYKGLADVQFMNMMEYDAMVPGNHEFDEGPKTFSEFVKKTQFPIVSSNIDYSQNEDLNPLYKNEVGTPGDGGTIYPAVILDVNGEKVGVFGLTTEATPELSGPGDTLTFEDHQEHAAEMVKMFEEKGINKIVALTHLGKNAEVDLAEAVEGIDVIVGGHSHTQLDEAIVVNEDTEPTVVVQAFEYSKYLGDLKVSFDANGVLTNWDENLVRVDYKGTMEPDPEAQKLYEELKKPLEEIEKEVVGHTEVFLDGERDTVRSGETNLGNLITDAMLSKAQEFTDATIAIQNGGGIRASIDEGPITMGEVLTTMPFGNNLVTLDLTGQEIIDSLEHGVSGIEDGQGRFPQVSGIMYSYDEEAEVGKRILDVNVKTEKGYEDIDPNATYTVATNSFMATGGDGYTVMGEAAEEGRMEELFFVDYELFVEYIDGKTIEMGQEARIVEEEATRLSGEDRYDTAIEVSKAGWVSADTVVLARGDAFPDALAGAPLAYELDAPILLTGKDSLNKKVKEEIKRLGAKDVVILGGTGAVSEYVEYQVEGLGIDVERISGKDRFDTAANIAARLGGSPEQAIVANGMNFPDALSIASYAARNGYPILLSEDDKLPNVTKRALTNVDMSIVAGGTGVISEEVEGMLPKATRYAGKDRFSTAATIATDLNPSARVFVATGMDFADALSGSVLAAKQNASILLVQPNKLPEATEKAIADLEAYDFTVTGGTGAVSDDVFNKLSK